MWPRLLSTAILAAVLWFGQPVSGPPGPLWVSNMVSDSGEVRLTALYDAGRGEMRVSSRGSVVAARCRSRRPMGHWPAVPPPWAAGALAEGGGRAPGPA